MIRVEDLTVRFGAFEAVRGISFHVREGDIFAFVGPNGAGKTTTIRVLATLIEPAAGRASIDGVDVAEEPEKIRKLVGYMPDEFGVYDGLRVWENLDFYAAAYRMPRSERRRAIRDVMRLTDLTSLHDRDVKGLSKGMRQRLCLAKILLHNPKVLVLDEPASGLDPRARIEFRALVRTLAEMGKTIFISSHILTELREICNAVCFIETGRVLACGSIDEITDRLVPTRSIVFRVLGDAEAAAKILAGCSGVLAAEASAGAAGAVAVEFQGEEESVPALVKALVEAGVAVVGMDERARDLEHLFMRITKGEVA